MYKAIHHTARQQAAENAQVVQSILKLIYTSLSPKNISLQNFQHFGHQNSMIRKLVKAGQPIQMILPGFPAKSANRLKTFSDLPDYGELLGLQKLEKLCQDIEKLYRPGAKVIICSDGRVFNDLVLVSDDHVSEYARHIQAMIKENHFKNLSTYDLDDYFTEGSYEDMRSALVAHFSESTSELKQRVKSDHVTLHLFNGIHRFMTEDYFALKTSMSKNSVRKLAKKVTYEVIQRSNAWSQLLEQEFPDALRLSIHPQVGPSKKLGVQLVESPNHWRTPWHSVVLSDGQRHLLVRQEQARALGAELKNHQGVYPYFHTDSQTLERASAL